MSELDDKRFFRVYFSPEREIDNLMHALWFDNPVKMHGLEMKKIRDIDNSPEWFQEEFKKCKHDWQARSVISKLVKYLINNAPQPINELESQVEKDINIKSEEYIQITEMAYGKTFPYSHVNIFLTIPTLCPIYPNEVAFTLSISAADQWHNIIIHELNHMMFYYYYPFHKLLREINFTQYGVLLEALTVLSNFKEEGYPRELKIRKYIKELLKKGYTSDQVIQKLLKSKLLLSIKDDERVNNTEKYSFLDRLSVFVHDLKRKIYEQSRDIN